MMTTMTMMTLMTMMTSNHDDYDECGEQHRGEKIGKNGHQQDNGGDTKLNLKFFLADRFWITQQEAPGCMLKVTSPDVRSRPHYIQN